MNLRDGFWKFHNMHVGETGIIVANGPSLAEVPIGFLKSLPSIGCNRITAMTPKFVPTYYTCIGYDQMDTKERRDTIIPTLAHPDCKAAFLNRLFAHFFPFDEVYTLLGASSYHIEEGRFFSKDPLNIIGLGATMTFAMLEIAYFMGFGTVLIVGLDHNYPKSTKKHFYDDSEFPDFNTAPGDFYNNDNNVWRNHADIMLNLAEEVYREDGRQIVNLTGDSACQVFRKEALSAWYAGD